MESSGCKSRTAKASGRAGSECCHSPGDWWVRSIHSKEVGREDSAPKSGSSRRRRCQQGGRQHPDDRYCEVAPGSPESLARGMLPKGFPRNPGELTISARKSGNADAKGDCRRLFTDGGAVLRPRSTGEGGEPQGSEVGAATIPTGGKGETGGRGCRRKHRRDSVLDTYVPEIRQPN